MRWRFTCFFVRVASSALDLPLRSYGFATWPKTGLYGTPLDSIA